VCHEGHVRHTTIGTRSSASTSDVAGAAASMVDVHTLSAHDAIIGMGMSGLSDRETLETERRAKRELVTPE
jgi:hypothetical protein